MPNAEPPPADTPSGPSSEPPEAASVPDPKDSKEPKEPPFVYDRKLIPTDPGCYLFYDAQDKLLYVGKAKHLRKRVNSYFSRSKKSPKTTLMVQKIRRIETRVVHSEMEALVLENNLVKEFRPKFNILLRDDKNFLYLRITNEPLPRIMTTRRIVRDGSFYAGPKTSSRAFRQTIKFCQKVFRIRTCKLTMSVDDAGHVTVDKNPEKRKLPCLDYHVKKCSGPCDGSISVAEYQEQIRLLKRFLRGDTKEVLAGLQARMMAQAAEKKFEAAAKTRDLMASITTSTQKQTVQFVDPKPRDFVHFHREGPRAYFVRVAFRQGKFLDQNEVTLHAPEHESDATLVGQFLWQFYQKVDALPREIYLPTLPPDPDTLLTALQSTCGGKVTLHLPQRGEKRAVLALAGKNAQHFARKAAVAEVSQSTLFANALPELGTALGLTAPPRRIECYDISHWGGTSTVASQVVFVDGVAKSSQYRRFTIRSLADGQIDDFAAMGEVLSRRFARAGDQKFADTFPDLIVIDGGKGQLSSVMKAVTTFAETNTVPTGFDPLRQIIALAKREEQIFRPTTPDPLELDHHSAPLRLLQRLRDEAHRFAITHNRAARQKRAIKSVLDEIDGIGPRTKKKLLQTFGSVRGIAAATDQQLREVVSKKQLSALRQTL